jgi:hypothetical protein
MRHKTGPRCSVCHHERRHQIEIALTYKTPVRVVARRFEVSPHALFRHSKAHLSAAVRAAILTASKPTAVDLDKLRTSEAEGLLSALLCQRARLQQQADMALEVGSIHVAVGAERAITESLRLTAQLTDQLVQHHDVRHTNVLVSEDYLALRHALVAALRPYPEAMAAVGRALHAESKAAADIKAKANGGAGGLPLAIEHRPEEAVT